MDRATKESLFLQVRGNLYVMAWRYARRVGRLDLFDDIFQEAALILWKKLDSYDPARFPGTTPYKFAKMVVRQDLPRAARLRKGPVPCGSCAGLPDLSINQAQDDTLDLHEQVARLPLPDQDLLGGLFGLGSRQAKSYRRLAGEQGLNPGAVWRQRQQALLKLRRRLQPS